MRKFLHISFVVLLGLSVLAGCRREDMQPQASPVPEQVLSGPVETAMTLSLHGFGADAVLTKGDYTDVGAAYRYAHEGIVKDYSVFVFDAENENAFVSDGAATPKYVFNPAGASLIGGVTKLHCEQIAGDALRIEFSLDKPYKSLAVLVLANYGESAYAPAGLPSEGKSMADLCTFFAGDDRGINFNPTQSHYLSAGVPMYGFKVFGSLEGLEVSASNETKEARRLKFYKGMSTPLTTTGFKTASELERYAGTTDSPPDGYGNVRSEDYLQMKPAMARLHFRYEPLAGQPSATPASSVASVEIKSVKLRNYKKKVRLVPASIFTTPADYSPFTDVSAAQLGDLQGVSDSDLEFVQLTDGDKSWVAYVPEQQTLKNPAADPYKDPYLIVEAWVTDKTDAIVKYTFERDQITRKWKWDDNGTEREETRIYKNSPWTEWLQMQTVATRTYPNSTTEVPLGTYYNLVRGYTYEWIAQGIEGMTWMKE